MFTSQGPVSFSSPPATKPSHHARPRGDRDTSTLTSKLSSRLIVLPKREGMQAPGRRVPWGHGWLSGSPAGDRKEGRRRLCATFSRTRSGGGRKPGLPWVLRRTEGWWSVLGRSA